jgi:hypothetical protein
MFPITTILPSLSRSPKAAPRLGCATPSADSHKSADIPKCSRALVQEYEFALPVLGSGLKHVHLRINVTIDGEQITTVGTT